MNQPVGKEHDVRRQEIIRYKVSTALYWLEGKTFQDYMDKRKIGEAKRLLREALGYLAKQAEKHSSTSENS